MLPSVSIIIPAKNEEKNLLLVLPALDEAKKAYGAHCEVILVDNGSTDATRETALSFGCRVIGDESSTIAGLRNRGASLAAGEVLAFLDADCVVDPAWLRCCTERLQDGRIGLVGTRAIPDLENATWVEEGWYRLVSGAERPDHPRWIGSSNMVMKKSVFEEVGGFAEHLTTTEDVNLCNSVRRRRLICLEKRVSTVHLRESKTITELVRREIWRGKSSVRQLLESEDRWGDMNSITLSLLFGATLPAVPAGMLFSAKALAAAILLQLSLPLLMTAKKKALVSAPNHFFKVYAVAYAYILARSAALVCELVTLARTRKKVPRPG